MGTSASYGGPKGTGGLLPPWADDADATANPPNAVPVVDGDGPPPQTATPAQPVATVTEWGNAKSNLSKWARGTSGYTSPRNALRGFVGAAGGSRRAATAARSGRATAQRLGGFFAGVTREGFAAAAARLGVRNLVGRSATAVLAELVDLLTTDGASLEESVAREAAAETLEALFDRLGVNAEGLVALDRVDAGAMQDLLREFVTNYVAERFLQALGDCIDRGAISATAANALYDDVRQVVVETVKVDVGGRDLVALDWSGSEAQTLIEGVFTTAYSFIEHL
jgi:hypothetical protein